MRKLVRRAISRVSVRIQLGPFGNSIPASSSQHGGEEVLVEVRLRHADPADEREALDVLPPLHELLEAPVEIADVGFASDDLVPVRATSSRDMFPVMPGC